MKALPPQQQDRAMWVAMDGWNTAETIAFPMAEERGYFTKAQLAITLAKGGLTLDDVKVKSVGNDLVPKWVGATTTSSSCRNRRGSRPRARLIARNPQLVRDFMTAVTKATVAAVEHPAAAVEAIRESSWGDTATNRKALEAQVRATLPLLSTDGYMSPGRAQDLADWMSAEGLLKRKLAASALLTNITR